MPWTTSWLGFALVLGIWVSCAVASRTPITDPACFPPPDPSRSQFMVGYGSLMQNKSKHYTAPGTGPSIPVRITGFRRGWNVPSIGYPYHTTFLGIVADSSSALNGVIFQLPSQDAANLTKLLRAYDLREDLYCRQAVPPEAVKSLASAYVLDSRAEYWIYVNKDDGSGNTPEPRSSAEYPIVQSYVDIFISGCLELEQQYNLSQLEFAASCVRDTSGWDSCWVNDRIFPRRPFIHQPRGVEIDELLGRNVPEAFKQIKLDGQCSSSSGSSGRGRIGAGAAVASVSSLFAVNGLLFVYRLQTLTI